MAGIDTTLYINEIKEVATDSGDQTTYDLYGSVIRDLSDGYYDPLVYVNEALQLPADYTVNKTLGTITFDSPLTANDIVTVSYTWKYVADDTEVYKLEQPPNINVEIDVNGRRKITESYNKVQPYSGSLKFPWIGYAFFAVLKHIYVTVGTTFDIARASLSTNWPSISPAVRLMITTPIIFDEQPGVVGCVNVEFEVAQVDV